MSMFTKIAKEKKKTSYMDTNPLSRASTSPWAAAIGGPKRVIHAGFARAIDSNAAQDRANRGHKSFSHSEQKMLDVIKKNTSKEDSKKTYPISRAITSLPGQAVIGAGLGGLYGWSMAGLRGVPRGPLTAAGVLGGAAAGLGGGALKRVLHARGQIGRSRQDPNSFLPESIKGSLDQKHLDALRKERV